MKKLYFILFLVLSVLIFCELTSHTTVSPKTFNNKNFVYFTQKIIPIIEQRCSLNCHGVSESEFKSIMDDSETRNYFYFPINKKFSNINRTSENLKNIYKITKGTLHKNGHDSSHSRIDYSQSARYSPLLRKPLSEDLGGLSHLGINVFSNESDPDYIVFKHWIQNEIDDNKQNSQLSKSQEYFKQNVLGVYTRNGCFVSSCHSENTFNDFKLQSPLPITNPALKNDQGFSDRMTKHNHKVSLGDVTKLANLQGDVKLSRLIVKNLPLDKGGVIHRGGNTQFFESYQDNDVQTIMQWLKLEKEQLSKKLVSKDESLRADQLGEINGLAFIKGSKDQKVKFFNPDVFYPGSDIYILKTHHGDSLVDTNSKAYNITKFIHPNYKVHIQSFDISYDSKSIVFSMRKSIKDSFRLYQIDLDDNYQTIQESFKQLSFDNLDSNPKIHHIDPIFMPDPQDKNSYNLDRVSIAYASNENLQYSASMPFGFLSEVSTGKTDCIIDHQRTEKQGTFNSKKIHFLSGKNKGQTRSIIKHIQDDSSTVGSKLYLNKPLTYKPQLGDSYMIENSESDILPSYDIFQFTPSKVNHDINSYLNSKKQITFSSSQERKPTIRSTGEIMFSSLRNIGFQGGLPVFNSAIYRVHNGGFDYHIQGGNRSRYPIHSDSRELPQGLEIRLLMDPRNLSGGGQLVLADHGLGINIEENNPYDNVIDYTTDTSSSPPRFIKAQYSFKEEIGPHAITHTGLSPGGSFRDPYPLSNGDILVSYCKESIDHLDPNSSVDWNIYLLKFNEGLMSDDGKKIGDYKLHKLAKIYDSDYSEYNARPLTVRLKQTTQTHQKFVKRLDKIKEKRVNGILTMPDHLDGEVECYDYPLLESFLTNFAPSGAKKFNEKLKYVRILQQIPLTKEKLSLHPKQDDPFATTISAGIHTQKKIIAEIPLANDGSFYAKVPSNVPLMVQGLNSQKMALHSMNRFFYVQPGEKLTFAIPRSIFPLRCAGCHGSLTGNKVDGLGPPDLVSGASKVLATWDHSTKSKKLPNNHEKLNISVDFSTDVQKILNDKCVRCHGGSDDLNLSSKKSGNFSISYKSLLQLKDKNSKAFHHRKYINEREALSSQSPLIEKLTGVNYSNPNELNKVRVPHPKNNPLSPSELLTMIRWIDSGATFKGAKEEKL
ncbi:MAG: hypothetical protein KC646_00910 [Candidatus Cloacimonetes bacterium]|nr:hypothetical protein [Candidatus Cloacimonadota bacterium]